MSIIVSYPTVGVGCFAFVVAEKGSSAVAGGTSGTSATDSVQTTTLGKVSFLLSQASASWIGSCKPVLTNEYKDS